MSFDSYVQALQTPNFLLKGCKIFFDKYESYVDEVAESIWRGFWKGGQRPSENLVLGAAEIILIKWNCPYLFHDKPYELIRTLIGDRISEDLKSAYNSVKPQLSQLYSLQLGDLQFADHLGLIKQAYMEFRGKYTIQMVGSSKALHFIHPDLFVPWDTRIRENYHNNDQFHDKNHRQGSAECYADFMKTCNIIARIIVGKMSRDQLAQAHPAYETLSHVRRLAKMIDECNYCWFTKNERWDVPVRTHAR